MRQSLYALAGWTVLLLVFSFGVRLAARDDSQAYLWPTDASHAITSSFGEYRPGHFHAGIDIKTWGRTGYKVFAVRDGYIWKVRVSPFGYGKVVYQVLDTGEIAVYAHLSRFMGSVERRVRRAQKQRMRYSTTLVFKPQQIRVRKGQVIAYTGDTGVGYPHLHFELRDARNRPVNPFLRGFRVEDHQPPRIRAVAITPLAPWSRVDGDAAPVVKKTVRQTDGHLRVDGPVEIWGPVYLSVLASDGTDAVRNRISVYSLRLYLDGELAYTCRYDRFSYSQTGLVDLDRDYRLRVRTKDIYYTLYVAPENTLPFHGDFGPGSGVIWAGSEIRTGRGADTWLDRLTGARALQLGRHQARIVAEDFAGNRTEAFLTLHVVPPTQQLAALRRRDSSNFQGGDGDGNGSTPTLKIHLDRYETYARVVVTSDHFFQREPRVSVRFRGRKALKAWLVNDTTAVAVWTYPDRGRVHAEIFAQTATARAARKVRLYRLSSRAKRPLTAEAGAAEVRFPARIGYRTFFASVYKDTAWALNPDPAPFSTPVRIEPEDVPLRRRVTLTYSASSWLPFPLERLAWYYRAPDHWAFVGNRRDSGAGTVAADVKGFGTFAVVADTVAPDVKILWPRPNERTTRRRLTIRVRVSDDLSGIGSEDDFQVLLDGEKQIAEWDPERDLLRCYPDKPLAFGTHTVVAWLRDRCGNESRNQVTFAVVRRRPRHKKSQREMPPLKAPADSARPPVSPQPNR